MPAAMTPGCRMRKLTYVHMRTWIACCTGADAPVTRHRTRCAQARRGRIASCLAVPSPRAWRQSSNPADELTIGGSHVVSFTPCFSLPAYHPASHALAPTPAQQLWVILVGIP